MTLYDDILLDQFFLSFSYNIQLSYHLNQRLMYGKGERDMILMRHEVTIR